MERDIDSFNALLIGDVGVRAIHLPHLFSPAPSLVVAVLTSQVDVAQPIESVLLQHRIIFGNRSMILQMMEASCLGRSGMGS